MKHIYNLFIVLFLFPGKISFNNAGIQANEKNSEEHFKNDFDILLPSEYRDWENKNVAIDLNNDWLDLYQDNGTYYLGKVDYTIKRGYSECSGDSTQIINSKNNTILFINNSNLKLGEIKTAELNKNKIWPHESLTFNFGNDKYTLYAEGKVLSSAKVHTEHGEELYQNVADYKLYLSKNNGKKSLFLQQESFNDTFVELLFIGDIDKDGKPDFIFSANRNYEEERVLLYLSSKAKERKLIKKVSEIAIQFDC